MSTDHTTGDALRPAKAPVGTGLTPLFGQLVALLVIALGVVGVQEALSRTGIVKTSWLSWALTQVSGRTATFSLLVLFVVFALLGLGLLLLAFKPRPRKTLTLAAATGVYLRTGDLTRIAQSRVDGATGVTDVDAQSSRGRLALTVSTVEPPAGDAALTDEVTSRLQPVLDALSDPPRLAVSITHQDLS